MREYGRMTDLYAPTRDEIFDVANRATLANRHRDAKGWLLEKLTHPTDDWDARTVFTTPGIVWAVESDTCMTGRPNAPRNIAYDNYGREFVYRQPENADELMNIMSADSEEVFSCYRFDGLARWTRPAFDAWFSTHDVVVGWICHLLATETESEIVGGLRDCHDYLTSDAFRQYAAAFSGLLGSSRSSV